MSSKDSKTWPSRIEIEQQSKQVLETIEIFAKKRRHQSSLVQYPDQHFAAATEREFNKVTSSILSSPFFASMCVRWPGEQENNFLSKVPSAGLYRDTVLPIASWTSPLGDLYIRAKNARLDGRDSQDWELNGSTVQVGPIADFRIQKGVVELVKILVGEVLPEQQETEGRTESVPPVESRTEQKSGLRAIITEIDLSQNERIRESLESAFILTGPPGTGKTTVALHRMSFLIEEQYRLSESSIRKDAPFFEPTSMLVLVQREHLKPYLRRLIEDELMIFNLPVQTMTEWAWERIRSVSPRAKFVPPTEDVPDSSSELKQQITPDVLKRFVGGFGQSDSLREAVRAVDAICGQLLTIDGYDEKVTVQLDVKRLREFVERYSREISQTSARGRLIDELRSSVAQLTQDVSSVIKDRQHDKIAREFEGIGVQLEDVRDQIEKPFQRPNYVRILRQFYESPELLRFFEGRGLAADWMAYISSVNRRAGFSIARSDWAPFLWIVHLMDEMRSAPQGNVSAKLERYSHLIIDEVQYVGPLMVNLLIRLTRRPFGSFTLVGDLAQKVDQSSGVFNWDEIVADQPVVVRRLNQIYRSTLEISDFLTAFGIRLKLDSSMKRPRTQLRGRKPQLMRFVDMGSESLGVAQIIQRLRLKQPTASICIVVPEFDNAEEFRKAIETNCHSEGLGARIAIGEDVTERTDKVIITDFNSIVGLEFDVVVITNCDRFAGAPSDQGWLKSLWVGVSRAKSELILSQSETRETIFDTEARNGLVEIIDFHGAGD